MLELMVMVEVDAVSDDELEGQELGNAELSVVKEVVVEYDQLPVPPKVVDELDAG